MATKLPKDVLKFFQQTGSEGGKARAKNHSKEQLSEWGKKGGRPKGSGKKKTGKQAKKGGK
jgi:general stress protein YciG